MRGLAAAALILSASAEAAPPDRSTVEYFPASAAGGQPAPYAIGANGLAGGALIELECWAYAGKKSGRS
jgi:hypothetical protein